MCTYFDSPWRLHSRSGPFVTPACLSTAYIPTRTASADSPFCHRTSQLIMRPKMPNNFLLLRVVVFVTCACSGFLGTSGACWIVGCKVLWCRIRVLAQYRSVLHSLIYIYFDFYIYFILLPSAQGPVLTMISGEVCFGSRVVLLCIHPDPLADPDKYLLPQVLAWAENGTTIDFIDPASARFTPIRLNSTASTLSFDITEEDYRDKVILCSCFLVRNNANRDRDESNALVLDPPGELTLLLC